MTPKTFRTTDLHLASALKLHGFKIIAIEKDTRSKKGIFSFEDEPRRAQFVQNFFEGSLEGSLKRYISVWADLKALINSMDPEHEDLKGGETDQS